jgi:hypothetical protein
MELLFYLPWSKTYFRAIVAGMLAALIVIIFYVTLYVMNDPTLATS